MKWEDFENRLKSYLGGKKTPGSGNKSIKGDVTGRNFVVEAKSTIKETMTVKPEWIAKLESLYIGKNYDYAAICLLIDNTEVSYILERSFHKGEVKGTKPQVVTTKEQPDIIYGSLFVWQKIELLELYKMIHGEA